MRLACGLQSLHYLLHEPLDFISQFRVGQPAALIQVVIKSEKECVENAASSKLSFPKHERVLT